MRCSEKQLITRSVWETKLVTESLKSVFEIHVLRKKRSLEYTNSHLKRFQ